MVSFGDDRNDIGLHLSLTVKGEQIKVEKELKNLGLWMDDALRFRPHVTNIVQRGYAALRNLYRSRLFLNVEEEIIHAVEIVALARRLWTLFTSCGTLAAAAAAAAALPPRLAEGNRCKPMLLVPEKFPSKKKHGWVANRKISRIQFFSEKPCTWGTQSINRRETYPVIFMISGFPGIIGCIDGTSIQIRIPKKKKNQHILTAHDVPSITLQGICDHRRRFIDVSTGAPGKVHDARVFKISDVSAKLPNICDDRFHILGDNAYPLEHIF
nr:unnamed protein product [Callosobruchus analis]